MEFVFATNNKGKIREVKALAGDHLMIHTLKEIGITESIPEPYNTFEQNAWAKAHYVYEKTGKNCFAEDSGIVVPALNGAPGVHSARYSGVPTDDDRNNQKLLKELEGKPDRSAWYEATICLILDGKEHYFKGKCMGRLITEYRGTNGFGYDPLFIPDGFNQTFGELDSSVKNKISHRSKAFQRLADFLKTLE